MTKNSKLNFEPSSWTSELFEKPFKLYKIRNVFRDSQSVIDLKKELNKLQFSPKMNDIFSLSQTKDFYTERKKRSTPLLQKFIKFLEQFREYLSEKLDIELDSKISVSSSKYSCRDYLLCHDDKCDDRHVAFIFYLNPTWKTEWGGSLDIFNHDGDGQPSDIARQLYPEFNSLIFFQVGNYTYHQVAEVVSDEAPRITINGWYHSKAALSLKPLTYCEPPLQFTDTHSKGGLLYLHHFANNEFLYEKYTELIVESMQESDVMMLQNFLKPHIYDEISKELCSVDVQWRSKGPTNRRKYDIADTRTLPPMIGAFINFAQSKYMCSYLEAITNYALYKKRSSSEYAGAVCTQIQFWKCGYYSLLTDTDVNFEEETLDVWLFFNVQEDTCPDESVEVQPGSIYYWEKEATSVKCEIEPKANSICLVRKGKNETTFVSYISQKSALRYHVLRIRFQM